MTHRNLLNFSEVKQIVLSSQISSNRWAMSQEVSKRSIWGTKLAPRADKGQQRFTFWLEGGRSCKTWQLY